MLRSKPSPYNAPVRRLASRGARPTVASITDLFVSSLVMASFCADHSPRGQSSSANFINSSKSDTRRWRRGHITNSRPLPPRKRLDCFCSSTSCGGVRCLRTHTVISRAFPQTSEVDYDHGEDQVKYGPYGELPSANHQGEQESDPGNNADRSPQHPPHLPEHNLLEDIQNSHTEHDSTSNGAVSADTLPDDSPNHLMHSQTPHNEEEATNILIHEYQPSISDTKVNVRGVAGSHTHNKSFELDRGTQGPSGDSPDLSAVERLIAALSDQRKSNQYIFRLYREIPSPGVSHIPGRQRGILLRRFADPVNKRRPDARRYLALVEDMIQADLHLSRSLWTSAIHLAGRAAGRVRKEDLERAIGIWRHMEYRRQIESDDVTFAVLFDIAIHAGQFTVAERIIEEMTSRGISFSRFGHVSKIFYFGMLGDADGIRQTFADFVETGHVVDTVVLNCLIASYARIGDIKMVMQLYESMLEAHKTLQKRIAHANKENSAFLPALTSDMPSYRRRSRALGRELGALASFTGTSAEQRRAIKEALPMSPDTRTFHILLTHYAYRTGNLHRFMAILEDMEEIYPAPPRGMIYLILFEGFARHGGIRKQWSADALRYAWQTFLRAIYESKLRYKRRVQHQMQKIVWENPLTQAAPTTARVPIGLYTPLPSSNANASNTAARDKDEQANKTGSEDESDANDDSAEFSDLNVDELFSDPKHIREAEEEITELDRQIENGVFLGRRIIMVILRAFGSCCNPDEVLDTWLTIERLWYPAHRKAQDVQIVKSELEKQLAKAERRKTERDLKIRRHIDD
ncbi:pentatricopeptide repeat protein [Aspergillus sclerotialis]|uniref:Pentatricopeptide repeat protein n=1 Tax=Aspergillus sclerotialis TaxID=2070753 RepID=A0A3A3A5W7_9EURO|nr:pentatricopeptide repeat protein [Aspergillus sclerotialis]